MRSALIPAAIAAAFIMTLATPASAQRRAASTRSPGDQVSAALDSATRSMEHDRYNVVDQLVTNYSDDSSRTWVPSYAFHASGQYAIFGVCTRPCTSLDIRVLRADGTQLARTPHPGPTSSVEFTAPADGSLRIVALMAGVNKDTDFGLGIRLFAR